MNVKEKNNGAKSASEKSEPIIKAAELADLSSQEKIELEKFARGETSRDAIATYVRRDLRSAITLLSWLERDEVVFSSLIDALYNKYQDDVKKAADQVGDRSGS